MKNRKIDSAGVIVSGAAGFIGSHLIDRLLSQGFSVVGIDNLCLGSRSNLLGALKNQKFTLMEADLGISPSALISTLKEKHSHLKFEQFWHLAANSDISKSSTDSSIDLKDTFFTTFYSLEIAEALQIPKFFFSSTSAVYGERDEVLQESLGPLLPISNYGAMKLASEAIISAAKEKFLTGAVMFRFPNVVGSRGTHGALYDFIKRLKAKPEQLDVLGDGNQSKPYLHVNELMDAMFAVAHQFESGIEVLNIGVAQGTSSVKFIAEEAVKRVAPGAKINYGTTKKGWIGDVAKFQLGTQRIQEYGWKSRQSSDQAISQAADELALQFQVPS